MRARRRRGEAEARRGDSMKESGLGDGGSYPLVGAAWGKPDGGKTGGALGMVGLGAKERLLRLGLEMTVRGRGIEHTREGAKNILERKVITC